ncbi:class I SAM-dependent methyltransferase [Mycolicibacterium sp. ND9-15]|uniref:class I SAM-dependent methyltransferase n=1 Tax=Mycolicibacterium sp. ND9-15 TaxID=3042320 RepID=UPI002DD846BE|nr:class I SAM-dependent methyltransferase [Mycolicibacterium sp. ND9-15]WSE55712.1 class I SAM-dependent methyltransferase [Mycolicibacterium sp. ND9-15]
MDDAVDRLRADYDAVPYESYAFPQTTPEHLAAVAHVFGLDTPAVSTARVLEIGCAAAGNLIPFAANHPHAHAVGIDLSRTQIDEGRRRTQALGLGNVELYRGDIAAMDLTALGQFDYIICHGVYSWVPENVQEAILRSFGDLLAPEGVAYISYNVYPGWKAKEIVRDAMLLRGGDRTHPAEKLSYARGMIDFLEQVAPADSVLARALADFRAERSHANDFYMLHEQLETVNAPCYFLDFGRRTEPYRLAYLADAEPQTMFARNYGEKVAVPLLKECGHSQVLVEQYLDFVANRTFRQSLLVRGKRGPQISYNLDRRRFDGLHFAAWLPPADTEPRLDDSQQEYGESPRNLFTRHPGVKAALRALNACWPWTLSRQQLLDEVDSELDRAGVAPASDQDERINDLLEALIIRGLVRYRLEPVAPGPTDSPLRLREPVRRMAELALKDGKPYAVNVWHEGVYVSPVDSYLLPLLDGSRDRDALVAELIRLARADIIRFERDGRRLSGEEELRDAAAEWFDTLPHRLAQMKLC